MLSSTRSAPPPAKRRPRLLTPAQETDGWEQRITAMQCRLLLTADEADELRYGRQTWFEAASAVQAAIAEEGLVLPTLAEVIEIEQAAA